MSLSSQKSKIASSYLKRSSTLLQSGIVRSSLQEALRMRDGQHYFSEESRICCGIFLTDVKNFRSLLLWEGWLKCTDGSWHCQLCSFIKELLLSVGHKITLSCTSVRRLQTPLYLTLLCGKHPQPCIICGGIPETCHNNAFWYCLIFFLTFSKDMFKLFLTF